jgi:hypothetical protein
MQKISGLAYYRKRKFIDKFSATFQFFNLVERKESKGLVERIDGVDQKLENTSDEDY